MTLPQAEAPRHGSEVTCKALCSLLQWTRIQIAFPFEVDAAFRWTSVGGNGLGTRSVRACLHVAYGGGGWGHRVLN